MKTSHKGSAYTVTCILLWKVCLGLSVPNGAFSYCERGKQRQSLLFLWSSCYLWKQLGFDCRSIKSRFLFPFSDLHELLLYSSGSYFVQQSENLLLFVAVGSHIISHYLLNSDRPKGYQIRKRSTLYPTANTPLCEEWSVLLPLLPLPVCLFWGVAASRS